MGKAEAALLSAVEGATKSWKRKLGPFFGSPLRALGCKKCYAPTSTELGSLMVREQFNKWTKICDKLVQASNDRLLGKPVEDEKTQKNIEVAERLVKMTHDQEIAGKTPFHEMMTPFEVMFVMLKSESGWSESGEEYSTFDWKQYEASKLAAAEAAETQNAVGPSGSENVSA
ncbi:MAG: hypothetical protein LQ350_006471 [Teloschistes chrysophthalmus]|nr:MAG: hypothetical protein LQ350_006471 [Niorma chrysophthalma]